MVEILGIIPTQHLHRFVDDILGMVSPANHMIGYQNIGMDIAAVFFSTYLKLFQKEPIILVRAEDSWRLLPRWITCCGQPEITKRGRRTIDLLSLSKEPTAYLGNFGKSIESDPFDSGEFSEAVSTPNRNVRYFLFSLCYEVAHNPSWADLPTGMFLQG
ncbi:MAG: hypothetical protein Q8K59_09035 [Nitrosomonas sp.]|nr:hypothetical protein [Nitrosomonas sp.]MDP1951219.1 hypothetical protein [Nitrosomonas sp.]